MIRVRPFADADLPAIQVALAGWIHEAGPRGYCHVGDVPHRIYETLHGRSAIGDVVSVWRDGSEIAGVAIATKFDRAFDVFASPAVRGTEAELEMIDSACATTLDHVSARGLEPRSVITDVFGGDDLRNDLLLRLGFERYRLWDYVVTLDLSRSRRAPNLPDGFAVRTATIADAAGLAAIRNDAFGDDWTADTYRSGVLEKPTCWPAREIVAVAPDGRIAAVAGVSVDARNRIGHFEPVATHSQFRRLGLARATMLEGVHRMQSLGMESATVEYDAENTAAHELYGSLGFERQFEIFGYRQG